MKHPLQALLLADNEGARIATLDGSKQISIREGDRDYREGLLMIVDHETPFVVQVDIVSVRKCKLSEVTKEEYTADGYTSPENMLIDMLTFYPNMTMDSTVTIIRWAHVRGYWVDHIEEYWNTFYGGY